MEDSETSNTTSHPQQFKSSHEEYETGICVDEPSDNTTSSYTQQQINESTQSITKHDNDDSNHLSSSFDSYNEEELRTLAEALAPKITSLFHSEEGELENLLSSEKEAWNEEEEKFSKHMTPDGKSKKFVAISMSENDESDDDYEEDGMQAELGRLSNAEQSLREELEMQSYNFEYLLRNNDGIEEDEEDSDLSYDVDEEDASSGDEVSSKAVEASKTNSDERHGFNVPNIMDDFDKSKKKHESNSCTKNIPTASKQVKDEIRPYTLYDHAKAVDLQFMNIDMGHPSCPMLGRKDAELLLDAPNFRDTMSNMDSDSSIEGSVAGSNQYSNSATREDVLNEILKCTREYVIPLEESTLKKIYVGLHGSKVPKSTSIRRSREDRSDTASVASGSEENYDANSGNGSYESNNDGHQMEKLPVRTIVIRIRPDILCGAVMDAIQTTVESLHGEMIKRQGGHFRAFLPGCSVPKDSIATSRDRQGMGIANMFSPQKAINNSPDTLPPFLIDAQLCCRRKSRECERVLLIRAFRIEVDEVIDDEFFCTAESGEDSDVLDDLAGGGTYIQEAAALFQRLRSVASVGGSIGFDNIKSTSHHQEEPTNLDSTSSKTKRKNRAKRIGNVLTSPIKFMSNVLQEEELQFNEREQNNDRTPTQKVAKARLLSTYTSTPSVKSRDDGILPIPALSGEDLPFVQSSWRFIKECLNELDNRDLAYSSMVSCPFGAFPSLPTLDVHYCSQMKEMCRENMVVSLVKSARELEQFAREAEFLCAKLIQVLRPTFNSYQLDPPPLPKPIPLTSYPLEFQSPETICPPWGLRVTEALNQISSKTQSSMNNPNNLTELSNSVQSQVDTKKSTTTDTDIKKENPFSNARESVSLVLSAFQRQEDEEMTARLSRKNVQVMDRLAKMQAHKRESIISIRDSYGNNLGATKAADYFHVNALETAGDDSAKALYSNADQVPLLTCRIFLGHSPGMCYVTSHQILILATQIIPILGGSHMELFTLRDIVCEVNRPSKSLLNPLPPSISLFSNKDNTEELVVFRPSIGSNLFKDFIDILKTVNAEEDSNTHKFSSKGGLLYMYDDKKSVKERAEKTIKAAEETALGSSTSF